MLLRVFFSVCVCVSRSESLCAGAERCLAPTRAHFKYTSLTSFFCLRLFSYDSTRAAGEGGAKSRPSPQPYFLCHILHQSYAHAFSEKASFSNLLFSVCVFVENFVCRPTQPIHP
jgi:hypothetical protein